MTIRSERMSGTVALLAAAACAGCMASNPGESVEGGGAAPRADAASCMPVERSLASGATMAGMAGRYDLVLVRPGDRPAAADGSVTLRDQPSGSQEIWGASTPLLGSTDVELDAVGALKVGDPMSEDPEAPGVLVLEQDRSDGRSVILRLGSEANRRDQLRFDGAYTVLRVHRIDADGFSGSWESGSSDVRSLGHFCAVGSAG